VYTIVICDEHIKFNPSKVTMVKKLHNDSADLFLSMFEHSVIAEHSRMGFCERSVFNTPCEYMHDMIYRNNRNDTEGIQDALMMTQQQRSNLPLSKQAQIKTIYEGFYHIEAPGAEYLAFLEMQLDNEGAKTNLWGGIVAHFDNDLDALQFKLSYL
jgi:hypothetical protein